MVRWSEVVNEVLERWKELAVICGCRDDEAESEVAQLPREPPEELTELRRCAACILREALDDKYVVQVPLRSVASETMVYVLEDALVELSDDCGYIASRDKAAVLLEALKDLGYEIDILRNFLETSRVS
ncbi:MAG: hypothetical protein GXO32_08980 [Crenarchaeota archaeon]|nr:hypothetical protein [Thermoproteota archaeon]